MSMISLVYVSSASAKMDSTSLLRILEQSKENNLRLGITGMLLYKEGNIIQAIEGPAEAVDVLYQRIEKDPRHYDVTELWREPIDARQFGNWSMGFRTLEELPPGLRDSYSDILTRPNFARAFGENKEVAYQLLSSFNQNIR